MSQSLSEWTAFYALVGGAAATLLGLLFVAVSLPLNIFHRREVTDIRDTAVFTFGAFLAAMAVAALAIAPHERLSTFAILLLVIGALGLIATAWTVRAWMLLNLPATRTGPWFTPVVWQGLLYMFSMAGPYLGLILAAILLFRSHPEALGLLAIVEASLLGIGTTAAWLLLTHACVNADSQESNDQTGP